MANFFDGIVRGVQQKYAQGEGDTGSPHMNALGRLFQEAGFFQGPQQEQQQAPLQPLDQSGQDFFSQLRMQADQMRPQFRNPAMNDRMAAMMQNSGMPGLLPTPRAPTQRPEMAGQSDGTAAAPHPLPWMNNYRFGGHNFDPVQQRLQKMRRGYLTG